MATYTITIDLDAPVPLADQLLSGLRQAIVRGDVAVGRPLPPVRQLAADLGIHFNTVARAYRELERQGLVRSVRGRGTVVIADRISPRPTKREAQRQLRRGIRELLTQARLNGLDRAQVETALAAELDLLWKEEAR